MIIFLISLFALLVPFFLEEITLKLLLAMSPFFIYLLIIFTGIKKLNINWWNDDDDTGYSDSDGCGGGS